jgi:amidophosphoribosyltransferase
LRIERHEREYRVRGTRLLAPDPLLGSGHVAGRSQTGFTGLTPRPTGMIDLLDHRDGPRDECGVFGIYAPGQDVSRLAYFGLFALQHRGQESAGIATAPQGGNIMALRELGLVSQVFDEQKLRTLLGDMALGHVRYSTTGSSGWENSQPVWRADARELALAHNGNLINAVELHSELRERGVSFRSTSDSEIIAALLSTHPAETIEDAVADVVPRLQGAFSTVVMTRDRVVAFRDPAGLRPLALGMLGDRYVVASESCAFDIIGAKFLRDVQPGEVVTLDDRGIGSRMAVEGQRAAFCVFEYIYFARPDSRMNGTVLQAARGRMGEILWREAPVEADVVVAVPDSGNAAARGVARASGLPQDDGFVKNRYVARTFIQPGQALRKHGLRMKFNPLPEIVAGQRLVVVDDSIVRGNTTRQIVQMLRDAGAAEIHLRITAPPIKHPCHYGIDMSTREEMIAHGRTVDEVAAELGCDSLHYLSLDGVYEAVGGSRETHCDACFSGDYPLAGTEGANGKFALEDALPLVRA